MQRHPDSLAPQSTVLLIIDVQQRFRQAMAGFEVMLSGCLRLAETFRHLELPVFVTEQYPKGLGRTVDELKETLSEEIAGEAAVGEKTTFSSCGCDAVTTLLKKKNATHVVVCGIETHVCVQQTVHDLLALDYKVHVAVDAVESRHAAHREVALERLARVGATLTTTEMAAFELLVDAKHPKFKAVQAIFK